MEPIPETTEAIDELDPLAEDDLLHQLRVRSRRVQELVPDCVGLSLSDCRQDVTLTLVATSREVAVLDAIQFLYDGPCVEAVNGERVLECSDPDVLDELGWRHFARATAAAAVASTLTLPVLADGRVVGSINLYAASANAFTGLHQEIARVFDAWAPGAVTNADLSFRTRESARRAPDVLRDHRRIDTAVGILAAAHRVGLDQARDELRQAARQAGVSEATLAETVIEIERRQDSD